MSKGSPGPIRFQDFRQRVRRFPVSSLLRMIAREAIRIEKESMQVDPMPPPFALAAIAKESLISGNDHRSGTITEHHIRQLCSQFVNLDDPITDGEHSWDDWVFYFLRIGLEQFSYQVSPHAEIARPIPLLIDTLETTTTTLIDESFWQHAMGVSILEYIAAVFLVFTGAMSNEGLFLDSWLDQPNFRPVFERLSRSAIESIIDRLSASQAEFRREAALWRSKDERFRRFDFNPLVATPLIRLPSGERLAPIPQLVVARLYPTAFYFYGLQSLPDEKAKNLFTSEFGALFEDYVGRQLRLFENADVFPEVDFGGSDLSVDWFVVFNDLVLLVEAKSTALRHESRFEQAELAKDLKRSLGKAFTQIERTNAQLQSEHPALTHIPKDRSVRGLVVTREPYYFANEPQMRALYAGPQTGVVPTTVCSIAELENVAALSADHPFNLVLGGIQNDAERARQDLRSAARELLSGELRNAVLEDAWTRFPWGDSA